MRWKMKGALLCALLSCALSGTVSAKKPAAPTPQLAATHGYVVVSFPKGLGMAPRVLWQNEGAPSPVRFQRADGTGESIGLEQRQGEILSYGAWLPAGEYRIAKWGIDDWKQDARFDVRAGRITDLGSLLVVDVGGYAIQVVPAPKSAALETSAERAAQQFASVLADPQPLGWTPPTTPWPLIERDAPYGTAGLLGALENQKSFDRNRPDAIASLRDQPSNDALLRQLKTLTPPIDIGRIAPDGTAYFPADYGVVRVRKPDGTWISRDTGTLERIHVVAVRDGALLAGTSTGRVLYSADDGATWTQTGRTGEREMMTDISRVGDRWFLAATRWVDHEKAGANTVAIRIYTATRDDASDLTLLREMPFGKKVPVFWIGRAQGGSDAYFVNMPDGLQRYDAATGQWAKASIPDPVSSFRIDDTGRVVTAFKLGGFSGRAYVSHDGGLTWKARARPFLGYADAMFDADDTGTAFRIEFGPKTERWEMHAYDAAKNEWARVNFLPVRCRPVRTGAGAPALCVTTGFDVYALRDGKWQVDFDAP